MSISDVHVLKNKLRTQFTNIRKRMSPQTKGLLDNGIFQRVIDLKQYRKNNTLLTYISKDLEVDTHQLIEQAWADGKVVAVPRCISGTEMKFYVIHSFDELLESAFGVLEPIPEQSEELTDFTKSVCIVPGLSFDVKGYRLGYGKGYYDRFLADYVGETVGICYCDCVRFRLPINRYDKPVDMLVTENYIRRTDTTRTQRVKS